MLLVEFIQLLNLLQNIFNLINYTWSLLKFWDKVIYVKRSGRKLPGNMQSLMQILDFMLDVCSVQAEQFFLDANLYRNGRFLLFTKTSNKLRFSWVITMDRERKK